jgi:hypothetical protein
MKGPKQVIGDPNHAQEDKPRDAASTSGRRFFSCAERKIARNVKQPAGLP